MDYHNGQQQNCKGLLNIPGFCQCYVLHVVVVVVAVILEHPFHKSDRSKKERMTLLYLFYR